MQSNTSEQARRAAAKRGRLGRSGVKEGRGHPSTSEPDYTKEEVAFMNAMQHFKDTTGYRFPTWSQVLRVFKTLGYEPECPRKRQGLCQHHALAIAQEEHQEPRIGTGKYA